MPLQRRLECFPNASAGLGDSAILKISSTTRNNSLSEPVRVQFHQLDAHPEIAADLLGLGCLSTAIEIEQSGCELRGLTADGLMGALNAPPQFYCVLHGSTAGIALTAGTSKLWQPISGQPLADLVVACSIGGWMHANMLKMT